MVQADGRADAPLQQIAASGAQERHRRRGKIVTGANPSGARKRNVERLRRVSGEPIRHRQRQAEHGEPSEHIRPDAAKPCGTLHRSRAARERSRRRPDARRISAQAQANIGTSTGDAATMRGGNIVVNMGEMKRNETKRRERKFYNLPFFALYRPLLAMPHLWYNIRKW